MIYNYHVKRTKDYKKQTKAIFWSDFALSVLTLIIGIYLAILAIILPFPERTQIQYMTKEMKEQGQALLLVSLFVGGVSAVISYITEIVLSSILIFRLLFKKTPKKYQFEIRPKKFNIGWIFYSVFLVLIPFIFFYVLFLPYFKWVDNEYDNFSFKQRQEYTKHRKMWKLVSLLTPIVYGSSVLLGFGGYILFAPKPTSRMEELQESYTISRDEPNTIILYFDRGHGLYMNEMIALDYLFFNKDNGLINHSGNSFAELFPECTSITNTLAVALTTNISNPAINGSWNGLPYLKNTDLISPLSNGKRNDKITQDEWFLNSYLSNFGLFSKYDYQNFSLINPPYWGHKTYHINANAQKMQEAFAKADPSKKINVLDSSDISYTLNEKVYGLEKSEGVEEHHMFAHTKTFDEYKQGNELFPSDINTNEKYINNKYGNNEIMTTGGKNWGQVNVSVSKDKHSTLLFNHSQITHEKYSYVTNDKYINRYDERGINYDNPSDGELFIDNRSQERQLPSMWYTLQKVKDAFLYLKNLPYCGPNSDVIKNQYDNSNIYIISDHGNTVEHELTEDKSEHLKLFNFLKSKQMIDNSTYNTTLDYLRNEREIARLDNMLIRKPRKYIHDSLNKKNQYTGKWSTLANMYDTKNFITLADFMPMVEADLELSRKDIQGASSFDFDPSTSYYDPNAYYKLNPNMSSSDRQWLDKYYKGNLILDPLNHTNELWDRRILCPTARWQYSGGSKKYKNMKFAYEYIYNKNISSD